MDILFKYNKITNSKGRPSYGWKSVPKQRDIWVMIVVVALCQEGMEPLDY